MIAEKLLSVLDKGMDSQAQGTYTWTQPERNLIFMSRCQKKCKQVDSVFTGEENNTQQNTSFL